MDDGVAFAAAVCGSVVYFLGFAVFKVAAGQMPPLRGTQPLRFIGQVLSSPTWLCGSAVMALGLILQFNALRTLPLGAAVFAFVLGLPVLPVIACVLFGESVSGPEWLSMAVMSGGALLIGGSGTVISGPLTPLALTLVVLPSQVLPLVVFSAGDWKLTGQHARRLTGIAYGLSAGVLIGLAELSLSILAHQGLSTAALKTPYPYVFALAVSTGIAQLQISLQRCRMVLVLFVATVTAKSYLVFVSSILAVTAAFGHVSVPWSLATGVGLLCLALLTTPRYEPLQRVR